MREPKKRYSWFNEFNYILLKIQQHDLNCSFFLTVYMTVVKNNIHRIFMLTFLYIPHPLIHIKTGKNYTFYNLAYICLCKKGQLVPCIAVISLPQTLFLKLSFSNSLPQTLFLKLSSSNSLFQTLFLKLSYSNSLFQTLFLKLSSSNSLFQTLFLKLLGVDSISNRISEIILKR